MKDYLNPSVKRASFIGTLQQTGDRTMEENNSYPGSGLPVPVPANALYLARWRDRFWAWLIDVILIMLFMNILIGALAGIVPLRHLWEVSTVGPSEIGLYTVIFFLYWTIFEGYKGQSIGKMVMNIRVVNRDGSGLKYGMAAVESLGKSIIPLFILDCLIGWLAMPGTKLRLFNRLSNTIVIKTDYRAPDGVVYIRK